jgi:phosphoglucosamine mutase
VNVRVREKKPLAELPEVSARVREAEADFGETGRILVRYSGTEKLARVMAEAQDQAQVDRWCEVVADAFRKEIGAE